MFYSGFCSSTSGSFFIHSSLGPVPEEVGLMGYSGVHVNNHNCICLYLISRSKRMEVNSGVQLLGQRMGFGYGAWNLFQFYPPPIYSMGDMMYLLRNVGNMYKGDFSNGLFLEPLSIKHILKVGLF